jgi:glutathione synthase
MRYLIAVNRLEELCPSMTTYTLMSGAARRGHDVFVCSVTDFVVNARHSTQVRAFEITPTLLASSAAVHDWVTSDNAELLGGSQFDAWLLRTNPGRDASRAWAHQTVFEIARRTRDEGVLVLNDPTSLAKASSKLYLNELPPELVPSSFVSNDPELLFDRLRTWSGRCVIKPLHGTKGRDVFVIDDPAAPNIRQIIDVVTRDDYALVQDYLEEEEGVGDLRMILVSGRLLEVQGRPAAIRRLPKQGDFRGNISVGGRIERFEPSERELSLIDCVGRTLVRDNLFWAGVDCIGGKVVEVNVFSPGGWDNAAPIYGVDFNEGVLDAIETELELHERTSDVA